MDSSKETKVFYKSRTLWINVLAVLFLIVKTVLSEAGVEAADVLDENTTVVILAALNMVMRAITKTGVTFR